MNVVVVESPAKAKTINRYLGKEFTVLASYGHVRDLPPKDGSVRPDEDFDMSWQIDPKSEKHLNAIAKAVKGADKLYLATDPDREGEAISWHVCEVLNERKVIKDVEVKRVVFYEITKSAVLDAIANPRDLDHELIDAYLARRALDYLVGFTLSPVLWRKLPGTRSAGRVQSVALRLICERESEIEIFKPQEYWTVESEFTTRPGERLKARLTHLDGAKLDKFSLGDETAATAAVAAIQRNSFAVSSVERKTVARHPQAPFTTSTLQQEASRKLGFSASQTMRTAQRLYEGIEVGGETFGLITYMRTDSVTMSAGAVSACRELIAIAYGPQYVPDTPNVYKSKAKNAQEAHEAIRPTDVTGRPGDIAAFLDKDEQRLYELIWKRAMASAMKSAALEQVAVDIASPDKAVVMRATGSVIVFDGFLKLYQEGRDDNGEDDEKGERILPAVAENDPLDAGKINPEQHFTKPPPRFTEASLVKRLEELGIGRPSTYASIISVLQARNYVRLESRRFIPEDRGRIVTAFLTGFFSRYVQYNFTAEMEDKLDAISNGTIDWRSVLREFWTAFSKAISDTSGLRISDVIDALDADLGPHFFVEDGSGKDPRLCTSCGNGRLGIKLGRHGAFIGCANYPDCKYTRSLAIANGDDTHAIAEPRELGIDPETGEMVALKKGPYGPYIQLGEVKDKQKPKRSSVPKTMDPAEVTLEIALGLLSLPREVGPHPETGEIILAGFGRYGPYLKLGTAYTKLAPEEDVLTIGLNRAVAVIKDSPKRGRRNGALRVLGEHPDDGKPVELMKGRYGPYVKHGRINATLPRDTSEEAITLEEALGLIAERAAKTTTKTKTTVRKKSATKKKKVSPAKKKPASAKSKQTAAAGAGG